MIPFMSTASEQFRQLSTRGTTLRWLVYHLSPENISSGRFRLLICNHTISLCFFELLVIVNLFPVLYFFSVMFVRTKNYVKDAFTDAIARDEGQLMVSCELVVSISCFISH